MPGKNRNVIIRIALLLMLALIICLLSGCGQKEPAAPTAAPETVTEAPTEEPTEVPTEAPTEEPTEAPTEAPTEEPTEAPTEAPTEEPTEVPTEVPTEEPTEAPTEAPTEEPTEVPTEAPTEEPAVAPTEEPAEETAETPAEEPAEAADAEPAATAEPVLLVTLNGQEFWSNNDYLEYMISYYSDYASYYGYDISTEEMASTIRQYSLQYTMRTALIRQKAVELGLGEITDENRAAMEATAKTQWEEIIQSYIEDAGTLTDESTDEDRQAARADAEAQLLTIGYDEARYVSEYIEGASEQLLTERVQDYLTEGKTVTDEEVQAYFDDLVKEDRETYEGNVSTYEFYTQYYGQSSYYVPEGYRSIVHILLPVDEELLASWKDLTARLEEQKEDEQSEPTETEPAESGG